MRRLILQAGFVCLSSSAALAGGRVLDGTPVAVNSAKGWCISAKEPLPNWDSPAHPECRMVWKILAEREGRILYSARYAWPSPVHGKEAPRVLTEVLYEGVKDSRVVRRLYAVQDDESHVRLDPIRLLTVGDTTIVESRVCMTGTGECGRELASWTNDGIQPIKDHTVAQIRQLLPQGYDLNMNPDIDLSSLTGSGKAWAKGDADCCPSASIRFTLRLEAGELHVRDLKFLRKPA